MANSILVGDTLAHIPVSIVYLGIGILALAEAVHKVRQMDLFSGYAAAAHATLAILLAAIHQFGSH
ncbi:hypothetical protein [Azospirillum griseum]|uniref:Uncharacterized protein n=1 Tax=Azospirillum griseum TaxID=2496639 RepID=A0A3S0IB85_9PROT|nr:hypothetical protein [Azospirillum griseum]RTR12780.1 hypothetical protein EJ903_25215 [Azospirillum griseum]